MQCHHSSRILYSSLMDVLGELHPRVQLHHFVRCRTCPVHVLTVLWGFEESPAAQVCFVSPLRGVKIRPLPLQHT